MATVTTNKLLLRSLLLLALPLQIIAIHYAPEKALAEVDGEKLLPNALAKRQVTSQATIADPPYTTGIQSSGSRTCSASSYLCPESLNFGCCPSGLICGLVSCFQPTVTDGTPTTSAVISATSASITSTDDDDDNDTDTSSTITSTALSDSSSTAVSTTSSVVSSASTITSAPASATPGEIFTSVDSEGTKTGTAGEDGVVRYCSTSSYLCPASVNYGCCSVDASCGLTNCVRTGTQTSISSTRTCSVGYLCPSSLGYGCCPDGYICGSANCYLSTSTGGSGVITATVTKTQDPFPFFSTTNKAAGSSTSAPTSDNSGGGGGGLSGGAIGGIVGGVVGGVALIAAAVGAFFWKKRRDRNAVPVASAGAGLGQGGPGMAQTQPTANPTSPGAAGYYQPQTAQPYNPATANAPSELGDNPVPVKPYGNQMGGVNEGQAMAEMPANTAQAPTSPVFEMDATSAPPR